MDRRKKDLTRFGLLAVGIIISIYLANSFYYRLDITSDKRFSVKPLTVELIKKSPGKFKVELLLGGKLNADYERLRKTIVEKFEEIKRQTGSKKFRFKVVNPKTLSDSVKKFQLPAMGIRPIVSSAMGENQAVRTLIYPAAVVSYYPKDGDPVYVGTMFIDMLPPNIVQLSTETERYSQALNDIDYHLSTAINLLTSKKRKKIGLVVGHGEEKGAFIYEAKFRLRDQYELVQVKLDQVDDLKPLDALIINRPQGEFSEAEKYKIDHFLNNGGGVFVMFEGVKTKEVDTVGLLSIENNAELRDILFTYGVRVNSIMIQDHQCGKKAFNVGTLGVPRYENKAFQFWPIINSYGDHEITKYLTKENYVKLREVCTIDTVNSSGLKKTPLLFTSDLSRVKKVPVTPWNEIELEAKRFPKGGGKLPVAWVLEGNFPSHFYDLPVPPNTKRLSFTEKGKKPGKLVVISDGEFIEPEVTENPTRPRPFPIGYDKQIGAKLDNWYFFKRSLDYLTKEPQLEHLNVNALQYHPLNKKKIKESKSKMMFINLVLPPLLPIVLFFLIPFVYRKVRARK